MEVNVLNPSAIRKRHVPGIDIDEVVFSQHHLVAGQGYGR